MIFTARSFIFDDALAPKEKRCKIPPRPLGDRAKVQLLHCASPVGEAPHGYAALDFRILTSNVSGTLRS
jgi:hypothetical protein